MIDCVLADEHPAVLDALSRLLSEHRMRVLAIATDGQRAIEAIEEYRPAIAVVELKLPRLSGVEIARQAAATTGIVIYTGHRERMLLLEALDAGARGIVLKEAPLDDLIRAVRTVAEGNVYVDPVLAGVLVSPEATKSLSERERSVLRLLADGYRNEAIGQTLSIAPDTVRAHVRNAMRKLQVDTRTQAVAEALRRSLIE